MQRLAERQRAFAAALLDPTLLPPVGLVGPDGKASARRFAVYRNNVAVALSDALQANFPAVCKIVGEEFFQAMARAFAASHPPPSPILLDYGAGFPSFIAEFEPAASLPYLPDVARIERAWTEAYHAREAVALEAEEFAAIPTGREADLAFVVHPSLRIVCSQLPALTIWRMNVADGEPAPVDFEQGGEDVLILRPAAEVEVRSLPLGGAQFVRALANGQSLLDAAKSAVGLDPEFDLSANIAGLISAGAFVGYRFVENASRSAEQEWGA